MHDEEQQALADLQDLRGMVLRGETVTREQARALVQSLMRGRAAAAAASRKSRSKAATARSDGPPAIDLDALINGIPNAPR